LIADQGKPRDTTLPGANHPASPGGPSRRTRAPHRGRGKATILAAPWGSGVNETARPPRPTLSWRERPPAGGRSVEVTHASSCADSESMRVEDGNTGVKRKKSKWGGDDGGGEKPRLIRAVFDGRFVQSRAGCEPVLGVHYRPTRVLPSVASIQLDEGTDGWLGREGLWSTRGLTGRNRPETGGPPRRRRKPRSVRPGSSGDGPPCESGAVSGCRELSGVPETHKASEDRGFVRILTTVCKSSQDLQIPPRGLEPLSSG
jgi:hypothetical protein